MKKYIKYIGKIIVILIVLVIGFIIYSGKRQELIKNSNNKRKFQSEEYKDSIQIKEEELMASLPIEITSKFEMYSEHVTIYKDRVKVRTFEGKKLNDIASICQKYYDKCSKDMYMSQNGPYLITELEDKIYDKYKDDFYSYPNSWDKDYDVRIVFENNSSVYIDTKTRKIKVFKMYNEVRVGKLSKKEYKIIDKYIK